jgi:hypothetical protein
MRRKKRESMQATLNSTPDPRRSSCATWGAVLIQHYSLRFVLTRNELLPQRLIPFLEYAVDLIFLRRVGGSYIFVHRLLMEHFAEMEV